MFTFLYKVVFESAHKIFLIFHRFANLVQLTQSSKVSAPPHFIATHRRD